MACSFWMNCLSAGAVSWMSCGNRSRRVLYTYNLAGALNLATLAPLAKLGQTPTTPCLSKRFTWCRFIRCRAEDERGLQGHEWAMEVGQVSL
jgi:hypothetical protein